MPQRRGVTRNVVLLAIAGIVLLLAAVRLFTARSGEDAAPTDPKSYLYFVCEDCGEYFHLNGREMEETHRKNDFQENERRVMAYRCKKCGKYTAVRALKCPEHGEIIKFDPGPKDKSKCSKCDFTPG